MRKSLILLILFNIVVAAGAADSDTFRYKFDIFAGASVFYNQDHEFSPRPVLFVSLSRNRNQRFSFNPSLGYEDLGLKNTTRFKDNAGYDIGHYTDWTRLHFITAYASARMNAHGNKWSKYLHAGPFLGYLIGARYIKEAYYIGPDSQFDVKERSVIERLNGGFSLGGGISRNLKYGNNLTFELRIHQGLSRIIPSDYYKYSACTTAAQFLIGYGLPVI